MDYNLDKDFLHGLQKFFLTNYGKQHVLMFYAYHKMPQCHLHFVALNVSS